MKGHTMSTEEIQFTPIAIKIAAPRTAHILAMLEPRFAEMDYDTLLHGNYVVFDYPENGHYTLVTEERFQAKFTNPWEPWFFQPLVVDTI
jgi:hypothetical protein